MHALDLLKLLDKHATNYRLKAEASIKLSNHMNDIKPDDIIEQRVVDAILVDFINYIGRINCIDYALYTKDFNTQGEHNGTNQPS